MIPHRRLNDEIFGNGLRDRVTACRKRLRTNRSVNRPQLREQGDESLQKISGGSEFPADSIAVRQSRGEDLASALDDASTDDTATLRFVCEQEVGVT